MSRWCPKCQGAKSPTADICPACKITQEVKVSVKTSVRYLMVGDYLSGSGITIARNPYTSVKCPKGRLWVEGTRANGAPFLGCWNASTTLTVTREV